MPVDRKKSILNRYAMNILQKVVTHVPKTRVTLLFPSIEYAKLLVFDEIDYIENEQSLCVLYVKPTKVHLILTISLYKE